MPQDYFGTEAQQVLLHRGRALFDLTRDATHFTYYGRAVGIFSPQDAPFEHLSHLAGLQGNTNYARVPLAEMTALSDEAEHSGFVPLRYARWEGGNTALQMAQQTLVDRPLPNPLKTAWLSPETPQEIRASLADMALACGVLPPNLAVLSGALRPGLCLMALDEAGTVVSCAAAAAFSHPKHALGQHECWWGMLATDPAWRGHGLSLLLGAKVMLHMNQRHGFSRFFTGVEPGNAPSEAVCARLGLSASDSGILGMADPGLLPGGRMTK